MPKPLQISPELLEEAMREERSPRQSFDTVIPGHVHLFPRSKLSNSAKNFYGVLRKHTEAKGYCWATNGYFADLMGVDERTIQRWLAQLEKCRIIIKDQYINNHQHFRRLWMAEIKIMFNHDKNVRGGRQKCHPEEENRNRDISPIVPKEDSPPKRKRKIEDKEQVAAEVWLTPKQQVDLLARCSGKDEKLKSCYLKLSAWKIGKQITGGNDYKGIINWVIKAVEEEQSKPKPQDRTSQNEKFANLVEKKFSSKVKGYTIYVGPKYLEFNNYPVCTVINFSEYGFKDQVISFLRKINADIQGLDADNA